MNTLKTIALLALLAFALPALAETYTATWEQSDLENVAYFKTQYKFNGAFTPAEKTTGDGFAQLGTTEQTTRIIEATPPADATEITFRVAACNAEGCSPWVLIVMPLEIPAVDKIAIPTAPFNLTLVAS